jgi:osmotically-inducible protein OsmY
MLSQLTAALAERTISADENLAECAARAVRATCVRPLASLTIVADEGRVILRGRARTFYEKQLLVHAVRHVPGVRQVVDHVDVLPAKPR